MTLGHFGNNLRQLGLSRSVHQDANGDIRAVYTDFSWIARRQHIKSRDDAFKMTSAAIQSITFEREGKIAPELAEFSGLPPAVTEVCRGRINAESTVSKYMLK